MQPKILTTGTNVMKTKCIVVSLICLLSFLSASYSSEFRINTHTTSTQYMPSVAYDGTNYLVTWSSYGQEGGTYEIYAQFINQAGMSVGSEFRINTSITSGQYDSSVVFDGSNYLVTWSSYSQDGSGYGVYGQRLSKSGTFLGSEFRINDVTAYDQVQSASAYGGSNYLITWSSYSQDGSYYGVYGRIMDASGNMISSDIKINSYTTNNQMDSSVSYDGNNFLVTWTSWESGSTNGVYGQFVSTAGALIGSEFRVNSFSAHNQLNSSVAFDGSNYLVVWESGTVQEGSLYGIYGQLINPSGTFVGNEFRINTYTTDNQRNPSLAFDGTDYLVVWESTGQDGSLAGIYGQRVTTSGELAGTEFLINTYTTDNQELPAIAYGNGNFLVTWQSLGQDGSNYGVYGDFVSGSGGGSSSVPEPSTILLVLLGIISVLRRRFA